MVCPIRGGVSSDGEIKTGIIDDEVEDDGVAVDVSCNSRVSDGK